MELGATGGGIWEADVGLAGSSGRRGRGGVKSFLVSFALLALDDTRASLGFSGSPLTPESTGGDSGTFRACCAIDDCTFGSAGRSTADWPVGGAALGVELSAGTGWGVDGRLSTPVRPARRPGITSGRGILLGLSDKIGMKSWSTYSSGRGEESAGSGPGRTRLGFCGS